MCCGGAEEAVTPRESGDPGPRIAKKGICLTTGQGNEKTWQAKVSALQVSWHYSWGASLPAAEPAGVEFVPMVWGYYGAGEAFLRTMGALSAGKPPRPRGCLLGFNEPDGKDQANLSVARALEAWPHLQKTGRRLGSPAAVHADREWMQEFMRLARERNYRVDFICVHWYGGPNVDGFVDYLRKVYALYGKPLWITEFAVADWQAGSRPANRHSPEAVLRFMKGILPRLDALEFVERYAWFPAAGDDKALGPSALFKADGSLTELGRCYAAHGTVPPPATAGGGARDDAERP